MRSVLRRPLLLASAVATVVVPGALAALAVLAHVNKDSAAGIGTGLAQGSRQEASLAPGGTRAAPDIRAPDIRAPVSSPAAEAARERGLRLLSQAAAAGRSASYQGVESIDDTTLTGPSTTVAMVWHRGGGATVTQLAGGRPEAAYEGDGRAPEGVFGVTTTLVGLLGKNYVPVYLGTGSLVGRDALIVAVQRADGSTAAQFWLDKRTMLPLRRDVYDTSARLVSDDRFTSVRFGSTGVPKAAAGPSSAAWTPVSSPAQLLSQLDGQGCLVPATLPGGLSLYAAARAATPTGPVADLGFSDGLSMVSLFVERGTLPSKMPGWQQAQISGRVVYVAQHELTMSGRGFVYTMVTDAPPTTVDAVVSALPANGQPGFLGRLGRGLSRLGSDLDPFG